MGVRWCPWIWSLLYFFRRVTDILVSWRWIGLVMSFRWCSVSGDMTHLSSRAAALNLFSSREVFPQMEDRWFRDDSSALHLVHTAFLLILLRCDIHEIITHLSTVWAWWGPSACFPAASGPAMSLFLGVWRCLWSDGRNWVREAAVTPTGCSSPPARRPGSCQDWDQNQFLAGGWGPLF